MKAFGTRPTYQIFSVATFITGCIYFLFNRFYLSKLIRKDEENDDDCKKQSSVDIEGRDGKESIDATKKLEMNTIDKVDTVVGEIKCPPDNIDGSSDSGVDNPAYSEQDSPTTDARK